MYLVSIIKVGFVAEKWTTQNKSISIKDTFWLTSALNSKIWGVQFEFTPWGLFWEPDTPLLATIKFTFIIPFQLKFKKIFRSILKVEVKTAQQHLFFFKALETFFSLIQVKTEGKNELAQIPSGSTTAELILPLDGVIDQMNLGSHPGIFYIILYASCNSILPLGSWENMKKC